MKNKLKEFVSVFKKTIKGWNADDPFRQSAVIAYYAIFSLPALLVLIINVTGYFFEREAISGEISNQISGVMGKDTAELVSDMVEKAGEKKSGIISTIVAIVTILFGATGVFIQLKKTLNQIWDVKEKPNLGFMKQLKTRFFSFGLILSIGFLLLVSLIVSTGLSAFSEKIEGVFPDAIAFLFYVLEFIVSLSVITVLFALMFKLLPDVKMSWRNVWTGAVLTGALFMIGKYALSLYFGKAEPGSAYGTAGSLILILLWVSYSSMIVFFGAEFTKQHAVQKGNDIEPNKDAIKIDESTNGSIEEKEHKQAEIEEKGQNKKSSSDENETNRKNVDHRNTLLNYKTLNNMNNDKSYLKEIETKTETKKTIFIKEEIKNMQDLKDTIFRKEVELAGHKKDIKDDLKPWHLIKSLFNKKNKASFAGKWNLNSYMYNVANENIQIPGQQKSLFDKVKSLFGLD